MQSCLNAKVYFLKMSLEGLTNPHGQNGSPGQISCHCLLNGPHPDYAVCCPLLHFHLQPFFLLGVIRPPFCLSKPFPSTNIKKLCLERSFA